MDGQDVLGTVRGQGPSNYPWAPGYDRRPLDEDVYGLGAALAAQPDVQMAPTVSEMFARSRLPRQFWYAPVVEPPPPKPTVPRNVALALGARLRDTRSRRSISRQQVADAIGLTHAEVHRVESGRVHPPEVAVFEAWLAHEGGERGAAETPDRAG